jgi:membrane-associated PAP2 superfamily phosphatase
MPLSERLQVRTVAPLAPVRWLIVPALLALLLIVLDQTTDLDLTISRAVYDDRAHAFALRSRFWLDVVMHHWAKYAVATLGFLVGAGLVLSYVVRAWKTYRPLLLFMVVAMALAPLSVALGKAASARHCPWDIDEFGGLVPYARIFDTVGPDIPAGHCFPAGHASTGFALMAFYFVAFSLRRHKAARYALLAGVSAGLVLGFGRVLQGAHFMSHVLWSGLLCWMVMLVLYRLTLEGRLVQPAGDAIRPRNGSASKSGQLTV